MKNRNTNPGMTDVSFVIWMPQNLPSILTVPGFDRPSKLQDVRFLRPSTRDVLPRHTRSNHRSRAVESMTLRTLTLRHGSVIPTHVHPDVEKLYVLLDNPGGEIYIALFEKDARWKQYRLDSENRSLVVPVNTPHAITGIFIGRPTCKILVVKPLKAGDIGVTVWEQMTPAKLRSAQRQIIKEGAAACP